MNARFESTYFTFACAYYCIFKQSEADGNAIDVKEVMDTWTLQMNYPVITIKKPQPGHSQAQVIQERFLYDSDANITSKYTSPFGYVFIGISPSYKILRQ